jgi:hypothetical protein
MLRSLLLSVTAALVATAPVSGATGVATPAGPLPLAPTITSVYPQMGGATLYFTNQAPAQGQYVQYFTATANPGGITATSNGNSNRIDVAGLTGGTRYTFTVTATNAAGTGPASAPSKSITAGNYADYWVLNDSGLNENWSYYPGSAGDGVNWHVSAKGVKPPSGNALMRFQSSSSGLFTLPYIVHSLVDSNGNPAGVGVGGGKFFLAPFAYLAISVWPTHPGQMVGFRLYQTNALNGALTQEHGGSTTRLVDSTQNWAPDSLSAKGFTFLDLATGKGNPIGSNSSDTLVTATPLPAPGFAGNYYELSQPDIQVGNYVQVGDGHNDSWGPASMTVGQWNTYRIPLSAFGNTSFPFGNQILKFALQDQSTQSNNTFYVTALGFTNH